MLSVVIIQMGFLDLNLYIRGDKEIAFFIFIKFLSLKCTSGCGVSDIPFLINESLNANSCPNPGDFGFALFPSIIGPVKYDPLAVMVFKTDSILADGMAANAVFVL